MTQSEIEKELRKLASKFSGVDMGHRLPKSDKGSARSVGITWVDDQGNDIAIEDTLLALADEVAILDGLKVK